MYVHTPYIYMYIHILVANKKRVSPIVRTCVRMFITLTFCCMLDLMYYYTLELQNL